MATQGINTIHAAVIAKFPDIVFGGPGVVVCRKIKNTRTPQWSQHAYGNAQDYGGPPEMLEALYQFLLARRGALPVGTLCHNNRGGCTSSHKTHVHVDALPRMKGTPKCAGGTPTSGPGFKPSTSGGNPIIDAIKGAGNAVLPGSGIIVDAVTGGNPLGSITDPLQAVGAAVALLFEPVTWIRVGLGIGGATLVLMGLSALLGDKVVDIAALAPGPVGSVAKVGAAVGGSR